MDEQTQGAIGELAQRVRDLYFIEELVNQQPKSIAAALSEVSGHKLERVQTVDIDATPETAGAFFENAPVIVVELRTRFQVMNMVQLAMFPQHEGAKLFNIDPATLSGEIGETHPLFLAVSQVCDTVNAHMKRGDVPLSVAPQRITLVDSAARANFGVLRGEAEAYAYLLFASGGSDLMISFLHLIGSDSLREVAGLLERQPLASNRAPQPAAPRPARPAAQTRVAAAAAVTPASAAPAGNGRRAEYAPVEVPDLEDDGGESVRIDTAGIETLLDAPVFIRVVIGETRKTLKDLVAAGRNTKFELDREAGEAVDIWVGDPTRPETARLFARGEMGVTANKKFGVIITKIVAPHQRLAAADPDRERR